jgi:hypothetical protein
MAALPATGGAPSSPNASKVDRRFDVLRKKVEQEAGAVQQQAQEGLARKAVAGGNQNSGAFIKLQNKQQDQLNTQKQNAVMDVESQREAAQAQADEIQAQRDFAKGEREASQEFSRGEGYLNRNWQAEQALKGRQFEAGEAEKNRTFSSKESALQRGFSEKLFNKEMAFKKQVQANANDQFKKQFEQSLKQFDFDKEVSEFNMKMAEKQFGKRSLMEGGKFAEWTDKQDSGGWGGIF